MKQRTRTALAFTVLWTRIAFRWAKPRALALKARLTPHAPKPVRFLMELFPYEPRPAIALGILAVLVVVTMGYGGITAIAYKQGVAGTIGLLLIFAVIGIGWGGVITVPIAWSRLWITVVRPTPQTPICQWPEEFVSPTLRGRYDPAFWDAKWRTLIIVNAALWGDEQLQWAIAQGYPSGEMPFPYERRAKRIDQGAVASVFDQDQLARDFEEQVPRGWETPVHLAATAGIAALALFLLFALLTRPEAIA